MIKAKVSTDYKDIERIFAGGSIQKEILKVWSTEVDAYVFESWRILEMEGLLPLTIKANGEPLIDYRIYGNTVQNDTPTPENPIMPIWCGVRTENVMPAGEQKTVYSKGVTFSSDGNGRYHISGTAAAKASARFNLLQAFTTPISVSNGGQGTLSFFNTQANINVSFIFYNGATKVDDWRQYSIGRTNTNYNLIGNKYIDSVEITVGSGETVDMTITPEFTDDGILPSIYEPYGYKLPILSNSTVTNIYLGESQTTRRIKKLVLTGNEDDWKKNSSVPVSAGNAYINSSIFTNYKIRSDIGYCTHYPAASFLTVGVYFGIVVNFIIDSSKGIDTTEKWKSYLAAQYAAGTPVTVWYILAEPETGIVNEPLMKIGNYSDTVDSTQTAVQIPTSKGTTIIDYDGEKHLLTSDGYELVDKNQNGFLLSGSTLRPSKMYIKYKGR